MDGLDAASVGEAVARAEPEVVVHEMTALAGVRRPAPVRRGVRAHERAADAGDRLPARGGRRGRCPPLRRPELHRLAERARRRAGEGRGRPARPEPARAARRRSGRSRHLERAVASTRLEGLVLRYGSLYGPGTSMATEFAELIARAQAADRRRRRRRLVVPPPRRRRRRDRRGGRARRTRASTTSSTTSRRRCPSGCRTSPSASARRRRGTSRRGSRGSRSARSASR